MPARKQPSDFHTLPMPARLRWSSSASPMPRVWSSWRSRSRKRRSSKLGASTSGPSAARRRSKRVRELGHQLEHRSVELDHLVLLGADHQPGAAGRAAPALPAADRRPTGRSCAGASAAVRSPSKRMNRCLPRASTARTARPSRRSGQRSSAWRGLRRLDLDDRLADQGGAHAPRRRMDGVALGHACKARRAGAPAARYMSGRRGPAGGHAEEAVALLRGTASAA